MCLVGDMEQQGHDLDPLDFVAEVSDQADLQAAKRRRTSNARVGLQSIRKKTNKEMNVVEMLKKGGWLQRAKLA